MQIGWKCHQDNYIKEKVQVNPQANGGGAIPCRSLILNNEDNKSKALMIYYVFNISWEIMIKQ